MDFTNVASFFFHTDMLFMVIYLSPLGSNIRNRLTAFSVVH